MKSVKKATTIADVAKKAGVSKTTVSFVLNNEVGVGKETIKKVKKVIKELNYIPNSSARSLRAGSTKRIAIVAYKISSNYLGLLIQGFEDKFYALNDQKHTIDFYSTESSEKKKNDILKEILYGRKADAVVLISQLPTKTIEKEYNKMGIPLLLVENASEISSSIMVNNDLGAKLAVEHLVKKGRTKIGIISPEFGLEDKNLVSNIRRTAYREVLSKHNLEVSDTIEWHVLQLLKEEGYEIADSIIDSGVDALFVAAGDLVTVGFIERCNERGIRIPEDISIVSYDNMFFSSLITPPLTTVNQPTAEMGQMAFEMVYSQIEKKTCSLESIVLEPDLVIRKSS